MTITLILAALIYFLCSAPNAIATGYFMNDLKLTSNGFTWLSFFNCLSLLRHTFNFFVLFFFNHKFHEEVVNDYRWLKSFVIKCK